MAKEQRIQIRSSFSVEYKVDFSSGNGKRKTGKNKKYSLGQKKKTTEKPHHVTRLLALAHHLQGLIDKGLVADYAGIARQFNLSRARLTQIMNLTLLAPQIQEEILLEINNDLFRGYLNEQDLRVVLKTSNWEEQLKIWNDKKALFFA